MRAALLSAARARLAGIVKEEASGCCRPLLVLVVTLAACPFVPSPRAKAQILGTGTGFANGGIDPFSFYYGYYLPHQAAVAAQPTPLDTINQVTAAPVYRAVGASGPV